MLDSMAWRDIGLIRFDPPEEKKKRRKEEKKKYFVICKKNKIFILKDVSY